MTIIRTESMRVQAQGRLLVFVHTKQDPGDEEWAQALGLWKEQLVVPELCGLIYTAGGAPNAAQRARLNELLAGRPIRIAVLTGSQMARTVGVAIRWFNPNFRMFEPNDFDGAMQHLAVKEHEAGVLREMVRQLRRELDHASVSVFPGR
jgi:hypothetical protein